MNADPVPPHPSPDEWSSFLYGELAPDRQAALDQHLTTCPTCREQVDRWRATMAALDAWKIPARRTPVRVARPLVILKWAAAAAIVLGAGLATGRLTAPRINTDQLRAELKQEFQAELQAAIKATNAEADRKLEDLAQLWAAGRAQDQQTTLALYQRAETQRKNDVAWLRRDLETLAVNADERLDTTQRNLSQLAAVSQTRWQQPDAANPTP